MTLDELLKMGVHRAAAEAIAARFKLTKPAQVDNHIFTVGCNVGSVVIQAQLAFERTQDGANKARLHLAKEILPPFLCHCEHGTKGNCNCGIGKCANGHVF